MMRAWDMCLLSEVGAGGRKLPHGSPCALQANRGSMPRDRANPKYGAVEAGERFKHAASLSEAPWHVNWLAGSWLRGNRKK